MDDQILNAKETLNEIIALHESYGDVVSLLTKIVGTDTDLNSALDSYQKNYFKNLFNMQVEQGNYFSAVNLASKYGFKSDKIDLNFSSPDFQKKYSAGFFKQLFDSFSKGDFNERLILDYLDFLSNQDLKPDFTSFNPLASKNSNLKATLGDTLLNVLNDKSYGVVGKCVTYFDFAKQSFVLEGNIHPRYCVRSDLASLDFPEWTYENGGGFNYHRSILPGNHLPFGGARYIFHQKGFVFFHHSGDFGQMSPYITELAVKSSKGKLHSDAFRFLDGTENYDTISKTEKEHSFGRTFLRKISSEAVNRIKHWDVRREQSNDLFATVESSNNEPEDDLPF
ncbi:hypothetical protein JXA48_04545 [Candidatus Woesearchaeota archaeon]|nr:hypothetical protein [Candidatus Woesearchaeota archaeon]